MKRNKMFGEPERVSPAWEAKKNAPKDPHHTFDPNVATMMILGLYPLTDNPGLFSFSSLYAAAAFIFYVCFDVFAAEQLFKDSPSDNKFRIAMYIRCINSFLNNSANLCWIVNSSRIRSLWITLLTDEDLDAEAFRKPRGSKLAAVLNPLLLLSVVAANFISRSKYWEITGGTLKLLNLSASCVQLLLLTARCWHHLAVVVMFKQRFLRLNSYMGRIRQVVGKASKERHKKGSVVPLEVDGGKDSDRIVADCRRVHGNLVRHCRTMAAAVGMSFLFDACSLFLFVTTSIYYVIDLFQRKSDVDLVGGVISRSIYISLRMVPMFAVIMGCDSASDEANHTRAVVSNALSYPLDQKTSEQLRLFTVQLLQWKVEFSASGVLVLDSTTIHAMIANILTYLVIIVQFVSSVDVPLKVDATEMDTENVTTTEFAVIE